MRIDIEDHEPISRGELRRLREAKRYHYARKTVKARACGGSAGQPKGGWLCVGLLHDVIRGVRMSPPMIKSLILAACAAAVAFPGAAAAEGVKLGFMAPVSGPLGSSGEEMRRGFDLALDELGNRLGGEPVTVVSVDDKAVPAV